MAGRQGRDEPFADDRQRAQPWGRGAGRSDQGQVRLAGADAVGEPVGVVLDQGDLDAGVGAVKGGEGIEQRGDGARGDHADHEPAADQPVHRVHGLPDGAGGCEYRAGVRQRRRSRGRQGGRAARPVDQGRAEIVLELPDLGADPRLADMHALRRAGEVRFLGHRDEVLQLPHFHIRRF